MFKASLHVNALSLAGLSVAVSEVDGWYSSGSRILTKTTIPRRAGTVVSNLREAEKTLRVTGTLVATSLAVRNTTLETVALALTGAPITLERVDATGRTSGTGFIEGPLRITPTQPGMKSRWATIEFGVTLISAYVSDTGPLSYGFGATRTAMPLGTGPVAPLIRIMGPATNPVLTHRNAAGESLGAVTFTIDLLTGTYLEVDCATYRIEKVVSGTRSDAYSSYGGNAANLPVLDPADGHYPASSWPSLEVSPGVAEAIYARTWR